MNTLISYKHFMLNALSILSLWATLGSSAPIMSTAKTINDISIKIVADRGVVRPGQKITYTITATNLGPDDAVFVDTAFDISDQLVVVSLVCDKGISPDGPFCEYSSLRSGASVIARIVATPKLTARARSKTMQTIASIQFETIDTFDPNMNNNKASVRTRLIGGSAHR
jgi:uncharacterized repeat protein (TIGR01451 family)